MKTHVTPRMCGLPMARSGLAIAALCLAGQVMAQAVPASGGGTPAPNERAKPAHGEVRPGPVVPPHYPSKPQPPVPTRR